MKYIMSAVTMAFLISNAQAGQYRSNPHYIATENAPKPLGAYSQGVGVDLSKGKLVFVSGQIANDPKTGKLYEDDIKNATRQALNNIQAILKASGSDLAHAVRMDVFLRDFKDWDGMNDEYIRYFPGGHFPARQTVQVGMENRIEISCIAVVPEAGKK